MIVSTGIDIVEVYRIREAVARTPRFAERVFTAAERAYCDARGKAADQSYAGRFAAKEAFFKALGTGWRGEIAWNDVEITADELGAPTITATGRAAEMLAARGINRIHVSISHTADHAVAQVIFES